MTSPLHSPGTSTSENILTATYLVPTLVYTHYPTAHTRSYSGVKLTSSPLALLPTTTTDLGSAGGLAHRYGHAPRKEPGWPDLALKALVGLTEGEFLYGGATATGDDADATDPAIVIRRAADVSFSRNVRQMTGGGRGGGA